MSFSFRSIIRQELEQRREEGCDTSGLVPRSPECTRVRIEGFVRGDTITGDFFTWVSATNVTGIRNARD